MPSLGGRRAFTFVRLPVENSVAMGEQMGFDLGDGDVLPTLLAPLFKSDLKLDPEVVARETAARYAEMVAMQEQQAGKGAAAGGVSAEVASGAMKAQAAGGEELPSSSELEKQAKLGVCEAWPLASASDANGWIAVKLYIDEVGALRKRPRNARAEALCAAAGQPDVTIHGDAYVGRVIHTGKWHLDENNGDFNLHELAHDSPWIIATRRAKEGRSDFEKEEKAKKVHQKEVVLASGADGDVYSWNQTTEEVEVRLKKGVPTGPASYLKKRIKVSYGRGTSLVVSLDGTSLLTIGKLFDRVTPDDCSWLLDGSEIVITMEKMDPRPWVDLALPDRTMAP